MSVYGSTYGSRATQNNDFDLNGFLQALPGSTDDLDDCLVIGLDFGTTSVSLHPIFDLIYDPNVVLDSLVLPGPRLMNSRKTRFRPLRLGQGLKDRRVRPQQGFSTSME